MLNKKPLTVSIRFKDSERDWLEKEAYNNGRTVSGEVRFRLRKQREQEQAQQESRQ